MEFNVAQLLKQLVGSRREYDVDQEWEGEPEEIDWIQGDVRVLKTHRSLLVMGEFIAQGHLQCSRCLESFDCSLPFTMEEEYFPTIDINTGLPLPLPEDEDAFLIDEHHVIDLGGGLRQYILLTIPMKPICQPGCAGLCPQCGANLSRSPCHCPSPAIDSRWASLSNWKGEK